MIFYSFVLRILCLWWLSSGYSTVSETVNSDVAV